MLKFSSRIARITLLISSCMCKIGGAEWELNKTGTQNILWFVLIKWPFIFSGWTGFWRYSYKFAKRCLPSNKEISEIFDCYIVKSLICQVSPFTFLGFDNIKWNVDTIWNDLGKVNILYWYQLEYWRVPIWLLNFYLKLYFLYLVISETAERYQNWYLYSRNLNKVNHKNSLIRTLNVATQ